MTRTKAKWWGIAGALVALIACGSPPSRETPEPGTESEARDTGPTDEAVFEEGFEQGDAGEWVESQADAPEEQESTEDGPGIE